MNDPGADPPDPAVVVKVLSLPYEVPLLLLATTRKW